MICPHCGCFFCPDAWIGGMPQIYCSEICGKYASRKRTGRKARERRYSRARRSHQRTCPQKIPYGDAAAAGAVLLRMRYEGTVKSGGVYQCAECGNWHVSGDKFNVRP